MSLKHLADVQEIALPCRARDDGELVVVEEGKALPFAALRMFTVRAVKGAVRGHHAHMRCTQLLICVHGAIDIECDDGTAKAHFALDRGDKSLLVPASIWATETYRTDGSVLTVLCDRHFEEEDYIRDYDQFLAWRRSTP